MRKKQIKEPISKRLLGLVGVLVALVMIAWSMGAIQQIYTQLAAVFFVDSSTPSSLRTAYASAQAGGPKFKILIVPGHDKQYSGTSYAGISEADLNLETAKLLAIQFASDPYIQADISRSDAGYIPELTKYFADHRKDIISYRASQTALMQKYLKSGQILSDVIVDHNKAVNEVALRLYGINMWANAHGYQLVIHIHFNDIPRKDRSMPGPYKGFSIYVPEHQFSNAKGSLAIANAVQARLAQVFKVSNHPQEKNSPIEDQELIAIGSNNSLDASSILIEYAYIYEASVQNPATRPGTLQAMVQQTYLGVEDFLKKPAYVLH